MAATPKQFVEAARSFVGTPFRHQGRVPGKALDCIGVVIKAHHALGMSVNTDYTNYDTTPSPDYFGEMLEKHFTKVHVSEMREGDVIWFAINGVPRHVGIYTAENTIVHAYALSPRKVIENRVDAKWKRSIRGVYRVEGLDHER